MAARKSTKKAPPQDVPTPPKPVKGKATPKTAKPKSKPAAKKVAAKGPSPEAAPPGKPAKGPKRGFWRQLLGLDDAPNQAPANGAKPAKKAGKSAAPEAAAAAPAAAPVAPPEPQPEPEAIPEPVLSKERRRLARSIAIDDEPEPEPEPAPEPVAAPEPVLEPEPEPTPETALEAEPVADLPDTMLPPPEPVAERAPEPTPTPPRRSRKVKVQREAESEEAVEEPEPAPQVAAPAKGPTSEEDWAAAIAAARRKPVHISDAGESPEPLQVEVAKPVVHDERLAAAHAPPEPTEARPASPRTPVSSDGLSLLEQYLLIALGGEWDDRQEKFRQGSHGPALVGALVLDLALRGRLKVQRDRLQVVEGPTGDADLEPILARLRELQDTPSLDAMRRLGAGDLTAAIRPWKARMARRGLITERTWRHLGVMKRSETILLADEAQTRLENRLVRLMSGGTADAQTICLLGLIDAAGLLPNLVPSSALAFNRSRIQGLITGRDKLGYLVDRDFKGMQEVLVTTVLANVKKAQRGG